MLSIPDASCARAIFRGATKGGLEGAQAPPSLEKLCPVIRLDPMTFLLGGYLFALALLYM